MRLLDFLEDLIQFLFQDFVHDLEFLGVTFFKEAFFFGLSEAEISGEIGVVFCSVWFNIVVEIKPVIWLFLLIFFFEFDSGGFAGKRLWEIGWRLRIFIVFEVAFVWFFICLFFHILFYFLLQSHVFFILFPFLLLFASAIFFHLHPKLLLILCLLTGFTFCFIWVYDEESASVGFIVADWYFWVRCSLRFPAVTSAILILLLLSSLSEFGKWSLKVVILFAVYKLRKRAFRGYYLAYNYEGIRRVVDELRFAPVY